MPPSPHAGKRVAVVGLPGAWSTEALADALEARTGFRLVVDMAHVRMDIPAGGGPVRVLAVVDGVEHDLTTLDGVLVKKVGKAYSPHLLDRLELLRAVEAAGVLVLSPPTSILRLLDRLACTTTLASAGVPMPETVVTEDLDQAVAAIERMGQAILKPLYSTKARGMAVLEAGDPGLREQLAQHQRDVEPTLYLQRRLDMPDRDLGVCFLGGEYLGTYARVKQTDTWNTTTRSGGKYDVHEPSVEVLAVATKAQGLYDMGFTSVDVVETPDGPLVFEVSAFGGFRGLKESQGVDAAALYADYALKRLGARHPTAEETGA